MSANFGFGALQARQRHLHQATAVASFCNAPGQAYCAPFRRRARGCGIGTRRCRLGRAHPRGGAAHRHARLGARHHPHAWARPQADLADRADRAGLDRGRQDRAQGRLRRPDAVGLAVGRARALARRQARVLSVVQHARRRDGAGAIDHQGASPTSRAASSPSRAARSTRAGCCCRRLRGAPASISGSRPASSTARRRCCPRRRCRANTTRR